MPIKVGASSTGAASGTQNVAIVAWDSTTTGRVVVLSQTGTANVAITGQPIGISGTVTTIIGTGTQNVSVTNIVTITGDVTAAAGVQYQQGGTAIGATGTGTLFMCIQSGGTTSRALAVTTSAAARVFLDNTVAGAVSIVAGTATQNVLVVAQPIGISGSVTAIGIATTADFFAIPTGGSIRYAGTSTNVNHLYLSITTSAASIVVTSAADKVHIITSLWVNGNTTAAFRLQSATTDIGTLFIATSGVGMVLGHSNHGWNRTTAGQSLVASAAASGSYAGWISYITVSG